MMCGTTKKEECMSMFWFMERACQALSELSQNLNNKAVQSRSRGPATNVRLVHPKFCYTRMMWCKYMRTSLKGYIYMGICYDTGSFGTCMLIHVPYCLYIIMPRVRMRSECTCVCMCV